MTSRGEMDPLTLVRFSAEPEQCLGYVLPERLGVIHRLKPVVKEEALQVACSNIDSSLEGSLESHLQTLSQLQAKIVLIGRPKFWLSSNGSSGGHPQTSASGQSCGAVDWKQTMHREPLLPAKIAVQLI